MKPEATRGQIYRDGLLVGTEIGVHVVGISLIHLADIYFNANGSEEDRKDLSRRYLWLYWHLAAYVLLLL